MFAISGGSLQKKPRADIVNLLQNVMLGFGY